jgi:uncharacterized SAM-binding protein YcdF (DUF218 family)
MPPHARRMVSSCRAARHRVRGTGDINLTALEFRILLKVLVLPPSGPLLLGIAGLLLWPRRPRIGFALCAASIGSLWLLATPLISDALTRATEGYPALDPAHLTATQARAQAVVILGGGVRRNAPEVGGDAPAVHVDLRLIEGAKVARATHLPVLISGSPREAAAMRHFMEEDLQLPVRWVEGASKDTLENAVFSARLLREQGIDRIILVTSSEHMVRAAEEFAAAGLDVTAAPAGMWTHDERGLLAFVPSVGALDRSHRALYEWAGRLVRTR